MASPVTAMAACGSRCAPPVGSGCVHRRDHGNAEAVRHLHQADGLSIAFGTRHAEIVFEAAFGVGALFMPDDADAFAAKAAEAADDCGVVAEFAVAGEGDEVAHQSCDVVKAMRPLRMPGD